MGKFILLKKCLSSLHKCPRAILAKFILSVVDKVGAIEILENIRSTEHKCLQKAPPCPDIYSHRSTRCIIHSHQLMVELKIDLNQFEKQLNF